GPGQGAAGQVRERGHAVGTQHLVLDQEPAELLAHRAPVAAELAAGGREALEVAAVAHRRREPDGAALEGEHGHGDAPAVADLSDEGLARDARVLQEHLAELALARDLPQRPHRDAGRVELAEDERDAAVAVLRVGPCEDEDPVRPGAERGPDLLPVQHEVIAIEPRRGLERRQVAPRARLAEPLAPDLLAREERRAEAATPRLAAPVDERRPQGPQAPDVQDGRRGGARPLLLEGGRTDR